MCVILGVLRNNYEAIIPQLNIFIPGCDDDRMSLLERMRETTHRHVGENVRTKMQSLFRTISIVHKDYR